MRGWVRSAGGDRRKLWCGLSRSEYPHPFFVTADAKGVSEQRAGVATGTQRARAPTPTLCFAQVRERNELRTCFLVSMRSKGLRKDATLSGAEGDSVFKELKRGPGQLARTTKNPLSHSILKIATKIVNRYVAFERVVMMCSIKHLEGSLASATG